MLPLGSTPLFLCSPRWIRQKLEHTRTWLRSLFRHPDLSKVNASRQEKDRPAGGVGQGGNESCKLVILGHPAKPKHLRNAVRFIFRTEFTRFGKGASNATVRFRPFFKLFGLNLSL